MEYPEGYSYCFYPYNPLEDYPLDVYPKDRGAYWWPKGPQPAISQRSADQKKYEEQPDKELNKSKFAIGNVMFYGLNLMVNVAGYDIQDISVHISEEYIVVQCTGNTIKSNQTTTIWEDPLELRYKHNGKNTVGDALLRDGILYIQLEDAIKDKVIKIKEG